MEVDLKNLTKRLSQLELRLSYFEDSINKRLNTIEKVLKIPQSEVLNPKQFSVPTKKELEGEELLLSK